MVGPMKRPREARAIRLPDGTAVVIPPDLRVPTIVPRTDGYGLRARQQHRGIPGEWNGPSEAVVLLKWLQEVRPSLLPPHLRPGVGPSPRGDELRTVPDLVGSYIENAVRPLVLAGKRAPRTLATYRGLLRNHIEQHLGKIAYADLEAFHVDDLAGVLRGADLSESQVAQTRFLLSGTYKWAAKRHLVQRNVVRDADPTQPDSGPPAFIPTPADVRAFLDLHDEHDALWRLAFTTGMRAGELAGVSDELLLGSEGEELPNEYRCWQQVQYVEDPQTGERGPVIGPPKWGSRRELPLSAETARAVSEQADRTAAARAAHPEWERAWDGLIFANERGRPLDAGHLAGIFKTRATRAGWPEGHTHLARHFAVSAWIAADFSVFRIAQLIGHRSGTALVEHVYGHLFERIDRRAAEEIEHVLGSWMPSDAARRA